MPFHGCQLMLVGQLLACCKCCILFSFRLRALIKPDLTALKLHTRKLSPRYSFFLSLSLSLSLSPSHLTTGGGKSDRWQYMPRGVCVCVWCAPVGVQREERGTEKNPLQECSPESLITELCFVFIRIRF
jgi:hypothetical protein